MLVRSFYIEVNKTAIIQGGKRLIAGGKACTPIILKLIGCGS